MNEDGHFVNEGLYFVSLTTGSMTGPLAQMVTLVSYGNDYLFNGKLPDDFGKNQSFSYCKKVDFRILNRPLFFMKPKLKNVADQPKDWFCFLKKEGCLKLRLYYRPSEDQSIAKDYKLAGLIGGGGTWFIEEIFEDFSNAWLARWEVTDQNDPDDKIWTVNYTRALTSLPIMDLQLPLEKCKDELAEALDEIESFAMSNDLGGWGKQFAEAQKALKANHPEEMYFYPQLIPSDNYSLTAKQNLFGAGVSWVFGAMGSWNDLGFETEELNAQYETLTASLYDKVIRSVISGVNSY